MNGPGARWGLAVLGMMCLVAAGACDEDAAGTADAAGSDVAGGGEQTSDSGDGQPDSAGGGANGGEEDAASGGGVGCEACGEDEACIRGACVAGCGDPAGLMEAAGEIAEGLVPVAGVCAETEAIVGYSGLSEDSAVGVVVSEDGATSTLSLERWTGLSAGAMEREPLASMDVDGSVSAFQVFPGPYVAVDDKQTAAAWGYTLEGADFPGEVAVAPLEAGAGVTTIDAPGNYEAAMVDISTAIVNGLGAAGESAGQGLYVVELGAGGPEATLAVSGLGTASGNVVIVEDMVIAGGFAGFGSTWPDGSEGNRVFALPLSDVLDAAGTGAPIDAAADGVELALPADFDPTPDGRLVVKRLDDEFMTIGFDVIDLSAGDDGLASLGDPEPVVTGASFKAAQALPGGYWLLQHGKGLLLMGEGEAGE